MTFLKLKPWLILALIFVLGAATGVSLTIGLGPRFSHPPGAQQMKNRMLMGLTHRLNLTSDQQAKIDPIVTSIQSQIQQVHREEVGRISRIMEAANTQILPLLNSDQQAELQKMEKEMESQHDRDRTSAGHLHSHMQSESSEDSSPPNGAAPKNAPPEPPPGPPPQK